jgi:multidrug/hemolysin transport system permease protein
MYLRDRATLLFSLMAPAILMVLYVAFLGKMQVDSLRQNLPGVTDSQALGATAAWVSAALLTITALTGPLVGVSQLVTDRTSHRLDDFLVSPLTRRELIGGLWIAVVLYSGTILMALAVICCVVIVLLGGQLPSAGGLAYAFGALVGSLVAFSMLHLLIATFLPSEGSVGAVSGLFSSVMGFLAGVYVPVGILGTGMASVVFALPFGQSGVLIRDALAAPSIDALPGGAEAVGAIRDVYGFDLIIGGNTLPIWVAWIGLALLAAVCGIWALARVRTLGRR